MQINIISNINTVTRQKKTAMLHMESFVDFCLTGAVYEIVLVN